jgi:hypothetical protein
MRRAVPADEMTSDERRREIAHLLAQGVLRLRRQRHLAASPAAHNAAESASDPLEVSGETVLSVHTG